MTMRKRLAGLCAIGLSLVLAGCAQAPVQEESRPEEPAKTYKIGEKAPVTVLENGAEKTVGYLTVDSIVPVGEQLEESSASLQIVAVTYTYENSDIEDGMLVSSVQLLLREKDGQPAAFAERADTEKLPQSIDTGKTCTAVQYYAVKKPEGLSLEYRHVLTAAEPMLIFTV